MKKRWMVILLAACMSTALLTACGGGSTTASNDQGSTADAGSTTAASDAEAASTEAAEDEEAAHVPTGPQIEETVIVDDDYIKATVTGLDASYSYPIMRCTITNKLTGEDDRLMVTAKIAVNGCMTSYGDTSPGYLYVDPGETIDTAFYLYENQYYGIYPERAEACSLDVAFHVLGDYDYSEQDAVPSVSYDTDFVHIETDAADSSPDVAPAAGTEVLNADGITMQYVDLVRILDGCYAYVFYVQNQNADTRTIMSSKVSVNGTDLDAGSCNHYDYGGNYNWNEVPFANREQLDYHAIYTSWMPFCALTVAPNSSAYIVMPLNDLGFEQNSSGPISLPLTSADIEFSIAGESGDPVIQTVSISTDSANATAAIQDISGLQASTGLSTWVDCSTDWNLNLMQRYGTIDEFTATVENELTTLARDLMGIDLNTVADTASIGSFYLNTSDSCKANYRNDYPDDMSTTTSLSAQDGYARGWSMIWNPTGGYSIGFSEEFLSSFKQALLDAGYRESSSGDSYYGNANQEQLHVSVHFRNYIDVYIDAVNVDRVLIDHTENTSVTSAE